MFNINQLRTASFLIGLVKTESGFKCLKESCFPDCWKVSSVVPVFKNVGEKSPAKNYHPVNLLSMVSKVFEKHVNTWIIDQLEECLMVFQVRFFVLLLLFSVKDGFEWF